MWRMKGGRGSLKSQPPLNTVMHPMFVDLHSKELGGGGGGGALFTEGGHYSPVNFVLGGHYSPVNFVLGGHYSPVNYVRGGQYSPVNYVRGDILWGDITWWVWPGWLALHLQVYAMVPVHYNSELAFLSQSANEFHCKFSLCSNVV